MLRNVLDEYLSNIPSERAFDLPFMALLSAMGFYDIHFIHSSVEFGKDFIAKKVVENNVFQFSFQSKAGDIALHEWRNTIRGQLMEALLSGLAHPNFDRSLSHQVVLVITGRLTGNVALDMQSVNDKITNIYHLKPIELWDKPSLLSYMESYGLENLYGVSAEGLRGFGHFLILYGNSIKGQSSYRDTEMHFRQWLQESMNTRTGLFEPMLETELIARQCQINGQLYERIHAYLNALRVIGHLTNQVNSAAELDLLKRVYAQVRTKVLEACEQYATDIYNQWIECDRNLFKACSGTGVIIGYPVLCSRYAEIAAMIAIFGDSETFRDEWTAHLSEFLETEPGFCHPASDRYAVSIVLPIIALLRSKKLDEVIRLIKTTTIWLCDQYETSCGLASVASTAEQEVERLLGYPFDFFDLDKRSSSFLATILCDLAGLADQELYKDVVNDIKASGILPEFWSIPDTDSIFHVDGSDILGFPHTEFDDQIDQYTVFNHSEHIRAETRAFSITDKLDMFIPFAMMILLRDRYFPTLLPSLLA